MRGGKFGAPARLVSSSGGIGHAIGWLACLLFAQPALALPPIAGDDFGTTRSGPTAGLEVEINAALNDSDPEGDPLDFFVQSEPTNGSARVSPGGRVFYTPNPGFVGTDSLVYVVSAGPDSDTATVTITVVANLAPIAMGESATVGPWPANVTIRLLDNDTDPDGDILAYRDVEVVSGPTHGSLEWDCLGACAPPRYTADLPRGYVGPDSFTYRAVDPLGGASAVTTVTIRVTGPPVAMDDTATTTAGTPVRINVLANDTDPDSPPGDLRVTAATSPESGTVAVVGRQEVEYRPAPGFTGTDFFSYEVTDAEGLSALGTVTVTVEEANAPPTAVIAGGSRSVPDSDGTPGERVTFDGSGSTDPDGTVIFYEWSIDGVAVPGLDTPVVTLSLPDGPNSVSLRVYDDREAVSEPATVTVTVAANSAPTAIIAGGDRRVADSNGEPGEAVPVDGSASSDPDGSIAAYQWSVNGSPIAGATGPSPTLDLADGANTVTLVVVDEFDETSVPASVVITIEPPNPGPTVTIADGDRSIPDGDDAAGELVPFEGAATDTDGPVDVATFRWSVNGTAIEAANGRDDPVLPLGPGTNVVTLVATDAGGASGSASVSVSIGEPDEIADLPGLTENQQATAEATESVCSTLIKLDPASLSPEQRDLRSTCDAIFEASGDVATVGQALDEISGEQVTAQQTVAIDFSHAQLVNIGARLRALRMGARGFSAAGLGLSGPAVGVPLSALASLGSLLIGEGGASGDDEGGLFDRRLGIFVNGSLRWGSKDTTDRETGFDFDSEGLTLGADYRFTDAFVAGLAVGYASNQADFDAGAGEQDSDGVSGSAYASWYGERGYVDTIASYGRVDYESVRHIEITGLDIRDTALGETEGDQWALGLGGGIDFGKGALRFGPTGSVNYMRVDIEAFSERTDGSSGLAMRFADQSAESLLVKAGGQVAYQLSRPWGILAPQARFELVHEFMNDSQSVVVRFANAVPGSGPGRAGDAFVVFTDEPDRNYFNWAVGVAATFANGFSGFIDYESVAGLDTIESQELSLGLRYQTSFR